MTAFSSDFPDKFKFFSVKNADDGDYDAMAANFTAHLAKLGLDSCHEIIKVSGKSGLFRSDEFIEICYQKLNLVHQYLKDGFTVFLCDLDIVFLKNPIPYLLNKLEACDIAIQSDKARGRLYPARYAPIRGRKNTGFYMVKPTELTIDFFDVSEELTPWDGDPADQGYLNEKVRQKYDKYKDIECKILERDLFPFGKWWYEHHKNIPDPYIIHYNWIWFREKKIERMKELSLIHI